MGLADEVPCLSGSINEVWTSDEDTQPWAEVAAVWEIFSLHRKQ